MHLKEDLELACAQLRGKHELSDNPGHPKGLSLKWRNETDWSICYKDKRFVPEDFSDVQFPSKVVEGKKEVDIETQTQTRIQAEQLTAPPAVSKNVVRSASDPRTNLLLFFDNEGNDTFNKCEVKTMKNVPGLAGESIDYVYFQGQHIATLKNGTEKIEVLHEDFTYVLCVDVLKTELEAKRAEVQAMVKEQIAKRKLENASSKKVEGFDSKDETESFEDVTKEETDEVKRRGRKPGSKNKPKE